MGILIIVQSTGDTNAVVVATAGELLKTKPDESIYILVVGPDARQRIARIPDDDPIKLNATIIDLGTILGESIMSRYIINTKLSKEQLTKVKEYLDKIDFDKALVGTPFNVHYPFQIAELISNRLKVKLVYNDYLLQPEKDHSFLEALKTLTDFTFLISSPKMLEWSKEINPQAEIEVIGHTSIDYTLEQLSNPATYQQISETRQLLQVVDERNLLLFISGTKGKWKETREGDKKVSFKDDKELLRAILADLYNHTEIEVRLGLHPGVFDLNKYIKKMSDIVRNTSTKLIITKRIASRATQIPEDTTIKAEVTGDQAGFAANAVACPMFATILTNAAIAGKPTLCTNPDREPCFVHPILSFFGIKNVRVFLQAIKTTKNPQPLTKTELGLPPEKAATIMANMLLVKPT